jgi:hypothetical protein
MTAPTTAADLTAALDDIRTGIAEATKGINDIVHGINSVLALLPDVVVARIRHDVAEMRRLATEQFRWVEERLALAGSPDTLRRVGSTWTTQIGAPTGEFAAASSWNTMQADDHWTGIAANAFRNTLPAQQAALIAVKATSDDVDKVLNDLAGAINKFWAALAGALITLVTAVISAAVAAGTVVAAPAAAGFAVAALVAFAGFVVMALTSFTDVSNQCATSAAELERRLNNDDAFGPGGAWPRSTTEISGDGSITDGDGSDWHVISQ